MRKIKEIYRFSIKMGTMNEPETEDIEIEFEEDITSEEKEKQIDQEFTEWMNSGIIDGWYEKIEEGTNNE